MVWRKRKRRRALPRIRSIRRRKEEEEESIRRIRRREWMGMSAGLAIQKDKARREGKGYESER